MNACGYTYDDESTCDDIATCQYEFTRDNGFKFIVAVCDEHLDALINEHEQISAEDQQYADRQFGYA